MVETHSGGGHVITIVFVDLVNSTAIKGALSGSDMMARNRAYFGTILTPHRQRVEANLAALGGRVVKTSGDDHLLVFTNAAQAAQWAVVLQTSHTQEPIATPLGPLQIRIGMHAGAPLTDPGDALDYVGHEVDYAKRVSEVASGGQILLSETTAALVRDARIAGLALHPHGERALKGIGRVPIFELLYGEKRPQALNPSGPTSAPRGEAPELEAGPPAAARERSATAVLLEALARGRLVGRDAEFSELQCRVDAAMQVEGSTVLLAGEPGIGKTRLATEAGTYAARLGFRVLTGRCEEEGAAPFQPFIEALRQYLNTSETWQVEQAMPPPVACELARIVPQVASKLREIPQVAPLEPEPARLALMEAALQFLSLLTTHDAPLLLFLDDLHWADEGSLSILQYLAHHAKQLRLLIVGTYRDVELDTQHPFERALGAMNRQRLYQRVSLRRLPEPAVAQMVAALLDGPPPASSGYPTPAAFLSVLYHETEGNPFYIEEVLKHLVEEGAIYRERNRWHLKPLEEFNVPESIKVTIGRRLQRLGEESREALRLAAVIGQQFSFEVLFQACGLAEDRLLDMLEEWLGAHLVVEQRLGREEVYRFHHAQIREVLYSELSLRRKARLHERVGLALEGVYSKNLDEHLDELAYHFAQAHGGAAVEKGVDYCLRAGEEARKLYANEAAIQHLTAALELLDGLPEDEPLLKIRWQAADALCRAYLNQQQTERALAVLQDYLTRAEGVGYPWGIAAAHSAMASHSFYQDNEARSIEHAEKSIQVCEQHGLMDQLASVRRQLATQLMWASTPDWLGAEALLRKILATPDGIPQRDLQATYGSLIEICARQGKWEEVAGAFRESIAVGGPEQGVNLIFCLATMERALERAGKHAEFIRFCDEAKELLHQADIPTLASQWYLEPAEPSAQFTRVFFHDDFNQSRLAGGWQWYDPTQASTHDLSERPGYLTIHAPPGADLFPAININAPRLLREMRGDFALETRMEGDWEEHADGRISGLLIWKDVLNFLRFDKFSMDRWDNGDIRLHGRTRGEYLQLGRGRLQGSVYFLRLERAGEHIVALCSTDGENWLKCGQALFQVGDPVLVGVHAICGMVAHFDYVRVLGKEGSAHSVSRIS